MSHEKIKVIVVPNIPLNYIIGGQEIQLLNTVAHLKTLGCEIRFFDFNDRSMLEWADLFHFFGINNLSLMAATAEQAKTVVSTVLYNSEWHKKLFIKMLSKIPKTLPNHIKKAFGQVDALLPNSNSEAIQLKQIYQAPADKIHIIPNAVDLDLKVVRNFASLKRIAPMIESENQKFILSVHRIEDRKNTLNLVKAVAMNAKYPLLLIGPLAKGEAGREYCQQVLSIIDKNPHMYYLGPKTQNEIAELMAFAHVHVLPSFVETPGLVSLEAGLNGCNLVVGRCDPVIEYFANIAWVCRQDARDIAEKIALAMTCDRDHFHQSRVIAEKFSWQAAAENTYKVYEKVLS